jgi:hypothetical protein
MRTPRRGCLLLKAALIGTFSWCQFVAVACAQSSTLDLNGVWQAVVTNRLGQKFNVTFVMVQKGDQVMLAANYPGLPKEVTFRGHIESNTTIAGEARGPSSNEDNPNWIPDKITLKDATHLTDSVGAALQKIAGPEDPRYAQGRATIESQGAGAHLPETPFDLAGTWQDEEHPQPIYRINIALKNEDVTMAYAVGGGPIFKGKYLKNPTIIGTGKSRASTAKDIKWVEWRIFTDDPDHIHINAENRSFGFFRLTPPSHHDLPCDAQNKYHVSRFFAWMRGQAAAGDKDEQSARCWLTISANQGYARGQSLLAAVLIGRAGATASDYQAAFQWAEKSAKQGDISGQLELASLYRDGKGTAQDAAKAQFWEAQAKRSKEAAMWQRLNAKNMFGLSALDVAKAAMQFTQFLDDADLAGLKCDAGGINGHCR